MLFSPSPEGLLPHNPVYKSIREGNLELLDALLYDRLHVKTYQRYVDFLLTEAIKFNHLNVVAYMTEHPAFPLSDSAVKRQAALVLSQQKKDLDKLQLHVLTTEDERLKRRYSI